MSSASRRSSVINTLFVVAVALAISAPALAGTGGAEFSGVYDWFTGLIQGTGGRLLGVLALIGAVAVSAVSLKVGGIGGLLFVVIASAFGVAFVNSMITALV
jgi:conjugal transfer pilus assembly protein TraA